ncbi:MAG: DegT/DnrJ/EryC1/StrS aminotransferase family protein [Myxococcales bacterium]|nr:DegT/DnrJ/EryC1/StrS aminotransferase family protein [Myxococcales bacterium]
MMRIPITKPWFDAADFEAIVAPLTTGWVVQGPSVRQFEQKFAAFTGAADAVACTSCTTALHLALAAAGIGPGDEVLVPSFTWVATANVVLYCGATPILVDIDLDTFNVDLAAMSAARTKHTRGVIPVHLFGAPVDMDALLAFAAEGDLLVVEDGACGLGTRWRGQHVGTFGDFGAFSFHPRKAVTTGEGGMVLARDPRQIEHLRVLRDHGASKSDHTRHGAGDAFLLSPFSEIGFNYRMTDFQGALGCTQMDKAPLVLEKRIALAQRYDKLLADLAWLRPPSAPAGATHSYQSYVCLFAPERPTLDALPDLNGARDALMRFAEAQGVATRQGTHAVHGLTAYRTRFGYAPADLPNAWLAEHLSITLPLYPQMTHAEQDYVVEVLVAAYEHARAA